MFHFIISCCSAVTLCPSAPGIEPSALTVHRESKCRICRKKYVQLFTGCTSNKLHANNNNTSYLSHHRHLTAFRKNIQSSIHAKPHFPSSIVFSSR